MPYSILSTNLHTKANAGLMQHLHDLSEYDIGSQNCLFVDLQRLLNNGFTTRNGDVRPANSLATACQLVAVIFQIQSQVQYGGVATEEIDALSKSISLDDAKRKEAYPRAWEYAISMLEREGKQSAQSLYHNLNRL